MEPDVHMHDMSPTTTFTSGRQVADACKWFTPGVPYIFRKEKYTYATLTFRPPTLGGLRLTDSGGFEQVELPAEVEVKTREAPDPTRLTPVNVQSHKVETVHALEVFFDRFIEKHGCLVLKL